MKAKKLPRLSKRLMFTWLTAQEACSQGLDWFDRYQTPKAAWDALPSYTPRFGAEYSPSAYCEWLLSRLDPDFLSNLEKEKWDKHLEWYYSNSDKAITVIRDIDPRNKKHLPWTLVRTCILRELEHSKVTR